MLVLSRRPDESIQIGSDITITVVSVSGSGNRATVRIGIKAPRALPVWRLEVLQDVKSEMERARSTSPADLDQSLVRLDKPLAPRKTRKGLK